MAKSCTRQRRKYSRQHIWMKKRYQASVLRKVMTSTTKQNNSTIFFADVDETNSANQIAAVRSRDLKNRTMWLKIVIQNYLLFTS